MQTCRGNEIFTKILFSRAALSAKIGDFRLLPCPQFTYQNGGKKKKRKTPMFGINYFLAYESVIESEVCLENSRIKNPYIGDRVNTASSYRDMRGLRAR